MNTNKIDLIKAEVVKLKSQLLRGACSSQIATETICKEEAYDEVLTLLDSLQEEPVSEDLEEAAYYNCIDRLSKESIEDFKAGAKWQKEKDKETIELAEDHAMLAGMEKMREEMMAKAIDVEVKVDAGGYPYIDKTIELYDYIKDVPLAKGGDNVKVIVILGE